MCALNSLEYEFLVENIFSKINMKNPDFRKVVLKDQNGNRQKMHLSETCGRLVCLV